MANPFEQFAAPAGNPFAKFAVGGDNPFAKFGAEPTTFQSQTPFERNVTEPLQQGTANLRAGTEMIGLTREQQKLMDLERLDNSREFERNARAEAQRTGQNFLPGENPVLQRYDAVQDPEMHRYAFTDNEGEKDVIRGLLTERSREHAQQAADQLTKLAALPQDEEFNAALQTGDWKTIGGSLLDDPMRIWRLSLQSAPQVAGALALTPFVGPAAGAGLTSNSSEMGQALIQGAINAGYNPYDRESLLKFMQDPQALAAAKQAGRTGGAIVGAFDALTAGIASKMLVPKKLVSSALGREATNIAVQFPIQAAGGAAGEALKQEAVSGEITSPGDVWAEAIGELGGTPGEVIGLGLATGRYKNEGLPSPDRDAPPAAADIERMVGESQRAVPDPTIVEPIAPEGVVAPVEEVAGKAGDVPVEQPGVSTASAPTETGLRLEDLPPSTEIMAGKEGISGPGEATKLARKASRGFKASQEAREQGQHESAQQLRKAAQGNLDDAVRQGFKLERRATPTESDASPTAVSPPSAPAPRQWQPVGENATATETSPTVSLHTVFRNGRYFGFVAEEGKEPQLLSRSYATVEEVQQALEGFADTGKERPGKDSFRYEVRGPRQEDGTAGEPVGTYDSISQAQAAASELNKAHPTGGYKVAPVRPGRERTQGEAPSGMAETVKATGANPEKLAAKTNYFKNNPIVLQMHPAWKELQANIAERKNLHVSGGPLNMQRQIVRYLTALMKRLTPDLKLIVDLDDQSSLRVNGADAAFYGFEGGYGYIWMSAEAQSNPVRFLANLAHEYGHAVMAHRFAEAGSDVQQALYATFQAQVRKHFSAQSNTTAMEFLTDLYSPGNVSNFNDAGAKLQVNTAKDLMAQIPSLNNWYAFDEWMAEQIGKWLTTSARPVSIADRYFKGVATALREVLKSLWASVGRNYDTNLAAFEPTKAVQLWMDAMLDKKRRTQPVSLIGAREAYARGLTSNAKALGVAPSEAAPQQSAIFYARNAAHGLAIPARALAQTDRYVDKLRFWPHILQLAWKNPHIAGLAHYVEVVRQWHIDKMAIVTRADSRVKEWRKLGKEQAQKLSSFLFALDSMEYLPAGQNARWPTVQELIGLAQKYGINQKALSVYSGIKGDFLSILDKIEVAWIKDAQRTFTDPATLAREIFSIRTEMNQLRSKPYFPHERFGDWTVTVFDQGGKIVHFEQVASAKEADRLAAKIGALPQFAGMRVGAGKLAEEVKIFRGLPSSLIKSMGARMSGLTQQQRDQLEQLAFDMSPANSFAKHFARRKGTPGYSLDAMRGYANYFLHAGGHVARLTWRADLEDAVKAVADSARAMVGAFKASDVGKRQGIADYMGRHLDYIMEPQNEWTALRTFAFFWHLAYNASSALVNITQLPMVAYPYLAGRFSDFAAMNAMRKSTMDLRKTFKLRGNLPQDEIDAIRKGVEMGMLDESMAADLAGAAQYGVLGRIVPGSAIERFRQGVAYTGAFLFQTAEKINRRIIFPAAYRLAKSEPSNKHVQEVIAANQMLYKQMLSEGWSPTNAGAFLFARDAIDKSMFNYSAYARPEFVRGKKGVVFAFWMFKQNMLYFYRNDPGAMRGLMILGATTGLLGLPFASDLADLIKYGARMFGADFDPEREARQLIIDLVGHDDIGRRTAEVLMHGLGKESMGLTWAGESLGVPIPGFDISNRLSMGNMIPGLKPLLQGATGELGADEAIGKTFSEAVGASYGVPLTMLRALETGDLDDFKTWERMLPAAAKNLIRAGRYFTQGEEVNKSGATIADFDVTDSRQAAEVIGQALGFTPTRVARQWDMQAMQRDAINYWVIRRKLLFEQFDKARQTKDREAVADAREAVKKFNGEAPDRRLRISFQDLVESSREREKNRKKVEQGKALQNTYSGVGKSVKELFPSQ